MRLTFFSTTRSQLIRTAASQTSSFRVWWTWLTKPQRNFPSYSLFLFGFFLINDKKRFAYKREVRIEAAQKTLTPYGGRLAFQLPGGSWLLVHLKDKAKIRNKKRWSQVMYMYYLLGYKYFSDLNSMDKHYSHIKPKSSSSDFHFTGFGSLLNNIDSKLRVKVRKISFFKKVFLLICK